MNKSIKMIISAVVIVAIAVGVFAILYKNKNANPNNGKINIVATTFSTYDFARQVAGDNANITFLLGPGVDAHGYEPTAQDLSKLQNADIVIYIGGEMEKWMDKVLDAGDIIDKSKTALIKVTDCVNTIEEEEVDGAEEEEEEEVEGAFDEHIWTAPSNAIKMVKYISEKISDKDSNNKETYEKNADAYIEKIKGVQAKIKDIVDNKKRDRLVFGDKMPMQYFLNEYGLKVSAAFNGCSTETEPSVKTIAYLINKVKEEKIPVVLYIELSTGKTAKSIASETGAKAMQIQTLHNISKDDFENGASYVSLMERNIDVLKTALQ